MQDLVYIIGTFDMIRSLFENSSPAANRWSSLLQLPSWQYLIVLLIVVAVGTIQRIL